MNDKVNPSSFAVALVPDFDEDNNWLGSVTTHLEEAIGDDLDEEQQDQIRSVCGLMASCLSLMEEDNEFLEYVRAHFLQNYEKFMGEFLDEIDEAPNFTTNGNVITLNFDTKTHGSA